MKVEEFDYYLPKELIARYPAVPRHSARLMVLRRDKGTTEHATFWELPHFLDEGDLLVFNDTKVIPARIFGRKPSGGKVEILLTEYVKPNLWKALVGGKKIKEGMVVEVGDGFGIRIREHVEGGKFLVELIGKDPLALLKKYGRVPLPPYLGREEESIDREYYQSVFASKEGAVAAPTASLHFSKELLKKLSEKGIDFSFITLHVSYGTFKPVKSERVEEHSVEAEYVSVPRETVEKIRKVKEKGKRVVAVGTTVVRALESAHPRPFEGWTNLYIYPGYKFKVVDALITNFHLPRSSLLFLVCAFGGKEFVLRAYREAVSLKYRFYSYGDGMLIL